MYSEEFSTRLIQLRNIKGVSARDMSLSIGQNPGYINNIETGKALPSMTNFFYICEYLQITPQEFFNYECAQPQEIKILEKNLLKLSPKALDSLTNIVTELAQKK